MLWADMNKFGRVRRQAYGGYGAAGNSPTPQVIHSFTTYLAISIKSTSYVKILIRRLRIRSTTLLRSPVEPNLGVQHLCIIIKLLRFYIYLRQKI